MKKRIVPYVESAILIALSVVLDIVFKTIPFFRMPYGGHVTLSMLCLIIIGLRRGVKVGLISSFIFALVNFILDGMIIHIGSIFFDYIFAYTFFGLSGLFKDKARKHWGILILVIFLTCTIRYIFSSLSGVIFFYEYAYMPDKIGWNISGNALYWVYSFIIYNLPYMLLSTVLSIIVALLLQSRDLIYYGIKDIENE